MDDDHGFSKPGVKTSFAPLDSDFVDISFNQPGGPSGVFLDWETAQKSIRIKVPPSEISDDLYNEDNNRPAGRALGSQNVHLPSYKTGSQAVKRDIWNYDVNSGPAEYPLNADHTGENMKNDTATVGSDFAQIEFNPGQDCQTQRDFYTPGITWLNGITVFICGVSTVLSALFVILALKGQRYGQVIGSGPRSNLSPTTANLWTSILAKIIELSFVTGFVAFLGQILSRRALVSSGCRGVTLSELSMWRWVVQPGTLITHSETARYAGLSILGVLTLLSTVLSTLYVTAATALVQPTPRLSEWRSTVLAGSVRNDFANIMSVRDLCQSPLIQLDREYGSATCLEMQNVGRSFYNLARFLENWNDVAKTNNGIPTDQEQRPALIGLPYANSTIIPQWMNVVNTTSVSKSHGRIVNNVSLAMPHIGVVNAVSDRRNNMPQIEESKPVEAYSLSAMVPSPVMKVLCVDMNETELSPIVYSSWNKEVVNASTWTSEQLMSSATTTNDTIVDEIFGWSKQDIETMLDYPPVFGRYPKPFSTVVNHTSAYWGRPAVYLLGQGGLMDDGTNSTGEFTVCKITIEISVYCGTLYTLSSTGSKAEARCGERADNMAFVNALTNATTITSVVNWRDVATDWIESLSLGVGISGSENIFSRMLMMLRLVPDNTDPVDLQVQLNPKLPSLAETLAVTAGYALLTAWQDTPFVNFWNYTVPELEIAQTQYFKAYIRSPEFSSGGIEKASKGWMVILLSTFLLNLLMLLYFLVVRGQVTDFSEPAHLFALAINSPPAKAFAGSCGGGPKGAQYNTDWHINHEGSHLYIEPKTGEAPTLLIGEQDCTRDTDDMASRQTSTRNLASGAIEATLMALGRLRRRLRPRGNGSEKTSTVAGTEPLRSLSATEGPPSMLSEYELEETKSRMQRQYS